MKHIFIWFWFSGQWPCDGPLVGIARLVFLTPWQRVEAWGPVGVCVGWTFARSHAHSMKGQHCQHPKDLFVCGHVWWGPCHLHETACLLTHDGRPLWGPVTTNGCLLRCQLLCLLQYPSAVAPNDDPWPLWRFYPCQWLHVDVMLVCVPLWSRHQMLWPFSFYVCVC